MLTLNSGSKTFQLISFPFSQNYQSYCPSWVTHYQDSLSQGKYTNGNTCQWPFPIFLRDLDLYFIGKWSFACMAGLLNCFGKILLYLLFCDKFTLNWMFHENAYTLMHLRKDQEFPWGFCFSLSLCSLLIVTELFCDLWACRSFCLLWLI